MTEQILKKMRWLPMWSLILTLGCDQLPLSHEKSVQFSLEIKQVPRPASPNFFYPGLPKSTLLTKASGFVEETVLLLPCDEGSGNTLYDKSGFGNNMNFGALNWLTRDGRSWIELSGKENAVIYNCPEFNATRGLKFEADISFREITEVAQIIFNRHNASNGYFFGLRNNKLFFTLRRDGATITLQSQSTLTPNTWYSVQASFAPPEMSIFINGKVDSTKRAFPDLHLNNEVFTFGARLEGGYDPIDHFVGFLDNIRMKTTVAYEEFDAIRIAVMDLSKFSNEEALYRSDFWHDFQHAMEDMATVPNTSERLEFSWELWKQVWRSYFTILSDQTLAVRGAFAEGTILGTEGLNLVVLAGLRDNKVIYFGQGFVLGKAGQTTTAFIEMWPLHSMI